MAHKQANPKTTSLAWLARAAVLFGAVSVPQSRAQTPSETAATSQDLEISWGPNLLDNGDFEEGIDGWHERLGAIQPGAETFSLMATDFGVYRSGGVSLRLQGDIGTTRWRTAESFPVDVQPGSQYLLTGWAKTADVRQEGEQYFNANLYVQFLDRRGALVPVGVQPVRGTRKLRGTTDWTELSLQVKAPDEAQSVRVGCALTCSGTMWVDDLTFRQGTDVEFKRLSVGRFDYFYLGEPPPQESIERNGAFLAQVQEIFQIDFTGRVKYYMFENAEQRLALTGSAAYSHAIGTEIHATGPNDLHNVAHVVLDQLGMSLPILREGTVYYATKRRLGGTAHTVAKFLLDKKELEPLADVLSLEAFKNDANRITKAYGASIVAFLLDSYGPTKFKAFYPYETVVTAAQELPQRAQEVYGMSLTELEAEWHKVLEKFETPGLLEPEDGSELDFSPGRGPRLKIMPPKEPKPPADGG